MRTDMSTIMVPTATPPESGRGAARRGHAGTVAQGVAGGVVAFSVGLISTATGAGLAVPRLATATDTPGFRAFVEAAAGVGALLAGLVLVLLGATALVRRTRGLWRLPVILGPGLRDVRRPVVRDSGRRGDQCAPGQARLRDPGRPRPGVLRRHLPVDRRREAVRLVPPLEERGGRRPRARFRITRSAVLDHAGVLARHGYGVLLYDARGHGRSAGQAMDFGWYGDADVQGAVSFLGAQPDVRSGKIAAVGLSMGGEEAIGAAATDQRIRAVVAEGATGRVAADNDWLSERYGAQGWMQERLDQLTYAWRTCSPTRHPPNSLREAVIATAPRPVLLIAAGHKPDEVTADGYVQRPAHHGPALAGPGQRPHRRPRHRRRSGSSGSPASSRQRSGRRGG